MKSKLLFFIVMSCFTLSGLCQNKTFIGLSSYFNGYLTKIADETNRFSTTSLKNISIGINFNYEIKNNIIVETGLILKNYKNGFQYNAPQKEGSFITSSSAIKAFQIPFRIKLKTTIGRNVSLITSLGYHFCYTNTTGSSEGYFISISETDTTTINYSSNYNNLKKFSLLESTIGLEFNLIKGCRLLFSGSYYSGFDKVLNLNVSYKKNNQTTQSTKVQSNGEYWSVGASFYYPIRLFKKFEKTRLLSK